ncbi:uncharacterized protein OCT59_010273 [Rhizophagus irregularis]|uniref:Uncharacterized protein n=1 Tax=Rhizophagus irregularis (strain DAOM 181602 / DAOM 197198 / MUCL 43194) TaxID=747089 RepID=U9U411_RHIID|nr:hypothetical protein GLOIN_2v1768946 [Rhizophagus irregularis DAOM 181602=DAOM 197198]POG76548.1 hypothetical protein GLOIN_2v1768946 [Rhizophagus irregularis DAOM 181602=DAOM 197198]UZO18966.1 hypothetical protein OCT59_010273 [Rhizophagus irregularis]GBC30251.1 hypothetical protein GLOIN_2v1768946 [Rhizophagus irregularis DAOM 181602=DAOM 197198]CAG8598691.1 8115_t:CDS:1 [Rhizophagus irregularis]|eukprot:XP_025183414.1 hypothetical protein GLOIN_2v1768946 [Rhizophagus irregularis DAOM 181602=DAOM 197198]
MLNQLFNIIVYGQKFVPESRMLHIAVLIDNKIYYIGGDNPNKTKQNPESDIFYLDVNSDTESFFTWVDLKVRLSQTSSHTANVGGVNQDSIYIIGGAHSDEKNTNYLYNLILK